jgi:LPXTG-motif cell wall-anchored protein
MNTVWRNKGGSGPMATGAAALALALAPAPLVAQSVSDYRLPGAETPRPNVQGPVDTDNPVVRGPAPRPSTAPPPAPATTASAPVPVPVTSPAASPLPRAVQPRPAPSVARPAPALPTAGPAAAPVLPPLQPLPSAAPSPFPAAQPGFAPAPVEPVAGEAGNWPWIAGGIALLLAALGTLLWWRRRRRAPFDLELEFEPPVVTQPKPEAAADPAQLPIAPLSTTGLGLALEVRRMNASLMATTLSYNLRLTNLSDQPLSALAIEGDMVAAHASLPPERQIASSAQRLELRHALVALAPGESAEFSGDFRLPLTAITPIRSGEAAFFVPLARLRVEASTPSGSPLVEAQTFVVGELPDAPGAALRPFRLDLGPRNYARVGQRAVN